MKYGTILVIDDNPSILTALKICLGGTFEKILTLPRPDTAPTRLQQEPVDIILLDMNFSLGVNSGQEGLLWLRTFRRLHANIPVVLITAYADIQLAIKGLKTGAADFITKPWDNDELIRTLKMPSIEAKKWRHWRASRPRISTRWWINATAISLVPPNCSASLAKRFMPSSSDNHLSQSFMIINI